MKTSVFAFVAFLLLSPAPTAAEALEIVLPLAGTIVDAGAEVTIRLVLTAGEEATEVAVAREMKRDNVEVVFQFLPRSS